MAKRKVRGLGKVLGVPQGCYAAGVIGGCRGLLTQEHPLSQAVAPRGEFDVQVRVQPPEAADWTLESSNSVRMIDACALILCEEHNGALSPTDREAARVVRAIQAARSSQLGSAIIDGALLTRWLCKVCCGYVAMIGHSQPAGNIAHPDVIRYAFGREPEAPLHFFFPRIRLRHPSTFRHALTVTTFRTDKGGPEAYHVGLFELDAIVSTRPGNAPGMRDVFSTCPGTGFEELMLDARAGLDRALLGAPRGARRLHTG